MQTDNILGLAEEWRENRWCLPKDNQERLVNLEPQVRMLLREEQEAITTCRPEDEGKELLASRGGSG